MSIIKIRVKTGPELVKAGFVFSLGGISQPSSFTIGQFANLLGKTLFGELQPNGDVYTAGQFLPRGSFHNLSRPCAALKYAKKRLKPKRKARPVKAKKRTAPRKKPKKAPKRRR